MSFDGFFMHHMVNELNVLINGKINKIYQITEYDFIFQIRNQKNNYQLLISLNPEQYRVQLTYKTYDKPFNPSNLTMFLRKHLEGSTIKNVTQIDNDRILKFEISTINELKDIVNKELIIELMGRYNNLILTVNNKIIQAYKYIFNIENNDRIITINKTYTPPIQNQINPFKNQISDINNIQGLSKEAKKEIQTDISFLDNLKNNVKPVIYKLDTKYFFYFTLFPSYIPYKTFLNLSEMLDFFYEINEFKIKSSQKQNNINHLIKRNIEKNELKLIKLKQELSEALNCETYKEYGDLLFTEFNLLNEKLNKITCFSYNQNKDIIINLDNSLTVKENAQLYYKKYKKKKTATIYINEQIEKAIDEINYFKILKDQLSIASLNDLEEITDELRNYGYLKKQEKKRSKKNIPNIITYILDENTKILVGKNNIQNDYITNTLAKPNDTWMHVANSPSSHILIKSLNETLDETTIRTAANICAYYSKYRYSSSVMVNYTFKKYLKKVKGKSNSFVTYQKYKSIYIDPDFNLIDNLKRK